MEFFARPTIGLRPNPFTVQLFSFEGGQSLDHDLDDFFGDPFFGRQQTGGMEATFANLLGHRAAGGLDAAFFQPHEEQEPRQPAAAEACLRTMPVVKVTNEDIEKENNGCSICFDQLLGGDAALRIPCGHLFHEECARKWLRTSNQCPVCRYELPTDDAAFEHGRRARMSNWRPRLRVKDMSAKSVKELRYLADHLGVRIQGCLEKHELVDAIVESGRVDIIPNSPKTPPTDSTLSLEPEAFTLPAIADGEPIIQAFLGGCPSLAALAKTSSAQFNIASKPQSEGICEVLGTADSKLDTEGESPAFLGSHQHPSSTQRANA